jgi:uncharacterized protein (DUF697 family)/tellurite resistance protein
MDTRDGALLEVGIAAALADGVCDERERSHLDALARAAGAESSAALAQHAALRPDLADRLGTPEARQAAYDLAVAVCHADGAANEAETRFLANLRAALRLSDASVAQGDQTAGALASAPVAGAPVAGTAGGASTEDMILQTSILAGALELLPQSLATMAVIPVQLRLVYQIGQRHGQKLDANQAKDLLATVGIGAATQVLDGVARRVLSGVAHGVLGRLLGGLAGGVAGAAAGAGTVFAATYALGHAAEQYYAQGRTLSTADLQALFAKLRDQAQDLYPKVQAQIQERARTLDLTQLAATLTRG